MQFILPFPPSVNTYWRKDKWRHHIYLSEAGQQYREAAGWALQQQKMQLLLDSRRPHCFPLCGRLAVTLTYHRGDNVSYDVDNFCKSVADLLTHCHIIVDDQQIDRLVQIRGAVRPRAGCVVVEVEEIT